MNKEKREKNIKKIQDFNQKKYSRDNWYVQVFEDDVLNFETKKRKISYSINWSAIGSINIQTTKRFIGQLRQAITLVNKLKGA